MRKLITALTAAGALAIAGGITTGLQAGPAALAPTGGTTATVPQSHAQPVPRTHPNVKPGTAQILLAGSSWSKARPDGKRFF